MVRAQQVPNAERRAHRTLYIVTALYVVIGFCIAVPAALVGDPVSAFLGFLIIVGSLGAAVVIRVALGVEVRLIDTNEFLLEVRDRLQSLEQTVNKEGSSRSEEAQAQMVDLAAFGRGDPSVLAAATLDSSSFPRLVNAMDHGEPVGGARLPPNEGESTPLTDDTSRPIPPVRDTYGFDESDVTTRNLLGEWKVGLRTGDLAACRAVFSTLVDILEPGLVKRCEAELKELTDRTEALLRTTFAECAGHRDYTGMLAIGEHICKVLPGRPIAEEFKRIEPRLLQRVRPGDEDGGASPLRVVQ